MKMNIDCLLFLDKVFIKGRLSNSFPIIYQKIISILLNPITLDFSPPDLNDFFLSLISAIVGFFILMLLPALSSSRLPQWLVRKTIHFLGGTYIAFVLFLFHTLLGIFVAIGYSLIVFILLIIFSRFEFLSQFVLLNFRGNEKDYSLLVNALLTLIVFFSLFLIFHNYPAAFTAGCLVIAWADASGEFFGKKLTFVKYRIFNQKSLSGSLAVFIFSCFSFIVSALYNQIPITISWSWKLLVSGLACAIVEALGWKWFDNILLPPCGSLMMFWLIS